MKLPTISPSVRGLCAAQDIPKISQNVAPNLLDGLCKLPSVTQASQEGFGTGQQAGVHLFWTGSSPILRPQGNRRA